jgi:hypothetical protein
MKIFFALLFATLSAAAFAGGPVRHVVHFKFKKDATSEQIQKVVDGFAALPKAIKEIDSLESGTNVSPEGLDKGFKHCWIVTFRSEADRDTYLHHPQHEAFVKIAKPLLEDVFVVDFIPAKATMTPVQKIRHPMRSGIPKAWGAQKTG